MAKKAAKKKAVRKKKPKPEKDLTRPAFGFWYPHDKSFEVVVKDFKADHMVVDEYWGEEDY